MFNPQRKILIRSVGRRDNALKITEIIFSLIQIVLLGEYSLKFLDFYKHIGAVGPVKNQINLGLPYGRTFFFASLTSNIYAPKGIIRLF